MQGNYEWSEKLDTVSVKIPLKGVAPSKVDILATKSSLKVNYSPYIIDLLLFDSIDPNRHKAKVKDNVLTIILIKQKNGMWGNLVVGEKDAAMIASMKTDILKDNEATQEELKEKRLDKRIADEKFALRKQMGLDESERTRLENLKAEEKETAEAEMFTVFKKIEEEKEMKKHEETVSRNKVEEKKLQRIVEYDIADIDDDEEEDVEASEDPETEYDMIDDVDISDVKFLAPPRSQPAEGDEEGQGSRVVGISFTPRVFPTPMRESKAAEEGDWIAKNRRHLKKHGVLGQHAAKKGTGSASDITEDDPTWLKSKGDDFVRHGDYRSAINAYSSAIDIDENMGPCYSNRSLCYLYLNMHHDCIADCSIAMAMIIEEELLAICKTTTPEDIQDKEDKDVSATLNSQDIGIVSMEDSVLQHVVDMAPCVPKETANARFPPVSKIVSLVKLLMRRGVANAHLGDYTKALTNHLLAQKQIALYNSVLGLLVGMEAAQETSDTDSVPKSKSVIDRELLAKQFNAEGLAGDISKLQSLVDAEMMKIEGDCYFADSDLVLASERYSEALLLIPFHIGALSNRAACKIALGDTEGCLLDSNEALALLEVTTPTTVATTCGSMLTFMLPALGSEKRKQYTLKTIVRRGLAYCRLDDLDNAIRDYQTASSIDPTNDGLKKDVNKLINMRNMRTPDAEA